MIYVTGDLHGEAGRFQSEGMKQLQKGDTLLVCGDFGFVWDGSKAEKKILAKLGKKKYQILFVSGCHDNYALLQEYPEVAFAGGRARQISGNIYELKRGEVYTIEEKRIFAFGGGVSDDEHLREEGKTWWREELPAEQEYDAARRRLSENGNAVDYILTHDTSAAIRQFLNIDQEESEIGKIHAFLNEISERIRFKAWFFGRYHQDKLIPPRYYALFQNVLKAPGQEEINGK